jgi:hypothetical protein
VAIICPFVTVMFQTVTIIDLSVGCRLLTYGLIKSKLETD